VTESSTERRIELQIVVATAEALMALFTLGVLIVNVYSMRRFNDSLELMRLSLDETRRSINNEWKVAQGDMLFQANRDFMYQEPHKKIIKRLESGSSLRNMEPAVENSEIEDHVGFLDLLGTMVRAQILDPHLVWELFSHYIGSAHDNPEIANYLRDIRKEERGYYSDFEWVYAEMQKLSDSKNRKK
jgi:hypothetical protein